MFSLAAHYQAKLVKCYEITWTPPLKTFKHWKTKKRSSIGWEKHRKCNWNNRNIEYIFSRSNASRFTTSYLQVKPKCEALEWIANSRVWDESWTLKFALLQLSSTCLCSSKKLLLLRVIKLLITIKFLSLWIIWKLLVCWKLRYVDVEFYAFTHKISHK